MLLLIKEDTQVSAKFFPNLLKTRDCKHSLALLFWLIGWPDVVLYNDEAKRKLLGRRCDVQWVSSAPASASGDPGALRAEAWGEGNGKGGDASARCHLGAHHGLFTFVLQVVTRCSRMVQCM